MVAGPTLISTLSYKMKSTQERKDMGKDALEYMNRPNDLELEVLRILNGEDVPGWTWGAAMSACCESLKSMGFAEGMYEISDKGKKFLTNPENLIY